MEANSPLDPAPPFDLAFRAPAGLRPGAWEIRHRDGTLLYSTADEDLGRRRLGTLRVLVRPRLRAGLPLSGRDVLVLFPASAPAPLLLSAAGAELCSATPPEDALSMGDLRARIARLEIGAATDEAALAERLATKAGVDPETASAMALVPFYERARELRAEAAGRPAPARLSAARSPRSAIRLSPRARGDAIVAEAERLAAVEGIDLKAADGATTLRVYQAAECTLR